MYDDLEYHMQKSPIEKVTDSHPNEKGHIQWSNILFEEIKKKKLIKFKKEIL